MLSKRSDATRVRVAAIESVASRGGAPITEDPNPNIR
jgi:hypothetical protein